MADAFTAERAVTIGHLGGWNVRKNPLTTTDLTEDGVTLTVPDKYATVRTNPFTGAAEALGVVGNTYAPIQNEEHCEILNRLVDQSGAIFDTAGSLRGGRQVFVSLQLPRTLKIGGVDPVRTNIVALNSHDASTAFRLLVTPVRAARPEIAPRIWKNVRPTGVEVSTPWTPLPFACARWSRTCLPQPC